MLWRHSPARVWTRRHVLQSRFEHIKRLLVVILQPTGRGSKLKLCCLSASAVNRCLAVLDCSQTHLE